MAGWAMKQNVQNVVPIVYGMKSYSGLTDTLTQTKKRTTMNKDDIINDLKYKLDLLTKVADLVAICVGPPINVDMDRWAVDKLIEALHLAKKGGAIQCL